MDNEKKNNHESPLNKRFHPRIAWGFMVRFRPHANHAAKWELATLKDVSEGGCSFFSGTAFRLGEVLEIEIQLPTVTDYMHFSGEVRRCEPDKKRHILRYGVAVQFTGLDEAKRRHFLLALEFLLKRQTKSA